VSSGAEAWALCATGHLAQLVRTLGGDENTAEITWAYYRHQFGPGGAPRMNAILQDDGTLLVPVYASCIAAERIAQEDPRFDALRAESVAATVLRGTNEEDAALAARWERNHDDRQPRSA